MYPLPGKQIILSDKDKKACRIATRGDFSVALLAYVCNSSVWPLTPHTPIDANQAIGAAMR
eukprot:2903820-Alexandrium_andersonii.AAC.1